MTNEEKLRIAVEKQAKQISKLKRDKRPFKGLKNYLLTLVAMLPTVLNVVLGLGLLKGELLALIIPILLLMYLENTNAKD